MKSIPCVSVQNVTSAICLVLGKINLSTAQAFNAASLLIPSFNQRASANS